MAGWDSAVNAGAGIISTVINNEYAKKREKEARAENYKYGEMAANAADARTRALYTDLYSPGAQLEQLQNAGLSPSLFYGDGGGIAGQSGAQGTGAAGIGPNVFGLDPMMLAQIGLMDAQKRKTNAEADAVEPLAQATIKQLLADADLKDAQVYYTQAETALKKVQANIAEKTSDFQIEKVKWEAKKFEYAAEQTLWEAKTAKQDYEFDRDTYHARVDAEEAKVKSIGADIMLKESEIKVNEAERQQIEAAIAQRWKELALEGEKIGAMKESISNQKTYWDKCIENFNKALEQDMKQFEKSLTQGYIKMGVQAVTSIATGALGGGIIKGLLSGGTKAAGASTYTEGANIWE